MADEFKQLDLHPDELSLRELRNNNNANYTKITENFGAVDGKVKTIQEQVDQLVVEGDSSPQIAQALAGTPYNTLKEKHEADAALLAENAKKVESIFSIVEHGATPDYDTVSKTGSDNFNAFLDTLNSIEHGWWRGIFNSLWKIFCRH